MTFHLGRARILLSGCLLAAVASPPAALGFDVAYDGPNLGLWGDNVNWIDDGLGEPLADFAEQAIINTGVTVVVDQAFNTATSDTGGVLLGVTGANFGGLTVANGGNLNIRLSDVQSAQQTSGTLEIGRGQRGFVTVQPGGALSAEHILLGGPTAVGVDDSKITLSGSAGLPATLTSRGETSLRRVTQITGPNVNFTSMGPLTLTRSHTLIADITGATHSPIKAPVSPASPTTTNATGHASVDGTLKLQFTGTTPALGNSWNIIDANTINGNFLTIDSSHASAALTGGKGYGTRIVNGGNGKLLQVVVEQMLTLDVNRSTGQVVIRNAAGAAGGLNDVGITGYQITSKYNSLTSGGWNSLADQGAAGFQEATPAAGSMGELKSTAGSLNVAGNTSRALGNIFTQAFPAFGTPVSDDLAFSYTTSDGVRQGFINMQGEQVVNNLRLHVNPTTGAAQLRNDSPSTIQIDGYSILSATNQLTPGGWNSLDDQNVDPDVFEAPGATNALSELVASGSLSLGAFQTYSLGNVFAPNGTQNLTLEFQLSGGSDESAGVVTYGAPLAANDADFDNDSDVDGQDFLVWQRGLGVGNNNATGDADGSGSVTGADLAVWKSQFGSAATASAAAVPEPAAALLMAIAGVFGWGGSRRRQAPAGAAPAVAPNRLEEIPMTHRRRRMPLLAMAAACLLIASTTAANAADILVVSNPNNFGTSEDQLITLLKSFGHTIVNEGDVYAGASAYVTGPPTAAELTNVDLVYFSRVANSGDYTTDAAETAAWNAIAKPMLMLSPQTARGGHATLTNNRFGWVNMEATTVVDNAVAPTDFDPFPNPAHPFVAGRTTDVFFLGETIDHMNRDASKFPVGSTTVATMTVAGNSIASIVDIPAGSTLFTNTQGVVDPLGGRRVLFQMMEYPDTHDVFRLTTNGGQILNQIINSLTLNAASMPPGDVDGNGVANIADFNLIRTNLGSAAGSRGDGDLNGDSIVNLLDYRLWKAVAAPADVAAAVIPEPTACLLAAIGMAAAARLRRRRRFS